jgi:dienelactone hydrolase
MIEYSLKERMMYRFLLNESRNYRAWYPRFLLCGVNFARMRRVVSTIKTFYTWCDQWIREGAAVELLALDALNKGNSYTARNLYHEAAGCYHIGEHIFFLDLIRKHAAQERARHCYKKAITLYEEDKRPLRIEVPFRKTVIPCYLHQTSQPDQPLVILINGLNHIKEVEQHYLSTLLTSNQINALTFDGPGQGEMWRRMKLIPDYESVLTAIIDWLIEHDNQHKIDLSHIGLYGWSLGSYLAFRSAAYDRRISCVIGNGVLGHLDTESMKKGGPFWFRDFLHVYGLSSIEEASLFMPEIDIKKVPALDCPVLVIQGGEDRYLSQPWDQKEYVLDWAVGEKEQKYYPDGEHCCSNYFDEVLPYSIDWFIKHLKNHNGHHEQLQIQSTYPGLYETR